MTDRGWLDGHGLTVLDRDECHALLAEADLGRVGFCRGGRPEILPVAYVVDAWDVAFRSTFGTKLQEAARGADVTFEVDSFDPGSGTGWSVQAHGPLSIVRDSDHAGRLEQLRLDTPVRGAQQGRWVTISIREITGRRLPAQRSAGG